MKNLNIQEISDKKLWNDFIFENTHDTFHQSWEWGDMSRKLDQRVINLGLFHQDNLVAACLVIQIKAKRGVFLHVPHGPVFRSEVTRQELEEELNSLKNYLIKLGAEENCSFIRLAPTLGRTEENQHLFQKLGFRPAPIFVQSELSLVLDISLTEEELLKNMRKSTRYILKRADRYQLRYMKSTDPEDFALFYDLYKKTVQSQEYVGHGYNFIKQEFLSFLETNSATLYFVFDKERLLSGAIIIHQNQTGFYHYGASLKNQTEIPSSHLLQWYIIQDLKRAGYTQYNFWGIAPNDKPAHPWKGLTVFKKGFGGVERQYLQTQDYILKWQYWLNWVIESARRIKRGY